MTEIRSKIVKYVSSIELSELMIKTWTERSNKEYADSKIREQEKIISDAQDRISSIRSDFESADDEIQQLKESIKYDKKQLILIGNAKLIEKLKKLKEHLEALPDEKSDTHKEA